ncbi:MAG TPA: ABC transporter permease [Blastocatellia bacterium]|nr:ABC transporter permease [Blastocatellia bacterium]
METLLKDARYGLRMLVRSPGFTVVALLSLALGIGANTAIFSIISAVLFAPLPVKQPGQLVSIFTSDVKNPGALPTSHLNFIDYREKNDVLTDILAYTGQGVSYSNPSGESKNLFALIVTGNYFDVLGVKAEKGRTFEPDEDRTPNTHPVVVLSHASWQRDFGGDPAIVGKTISLNRRDFNVVGVAQKDFTGTDIGGGPDLWVPMMMHDVVQPGFDWYNTRRGLFLAMIGRRKPGITSSQAQASMSTLGSQLEQEYKKDNEGRNVRLVPLLTARTDPTGDGQVGKTFIALMGVAGVVLLIACANVTNLLLARATRRKREIAIRLALGASRSRLIRQLMTESLLLSLAGGTIGFFVAIWSKDILRSLVPFGGGPNQQQGISIDPRVLLFALVVSIISGLLFGLAPALQASRPDLVPVLKGDITVPVGTQGFRINLRKSLVVVQVGLSLFALITAGLFVRSLQKAQAVNPGFNPENVVLMGFNLGREGYDEARGRNFHREVVERIGAVAGVVKVTVARDRPFGGGFQRSVFIEGQEPPPGGRGVLVQTNNIATGFFETLGIPLLQGRDFTETDNQQAPKVMIINEAMATRFWPSESAVGKRLKLFGDQDFRQVVGIVADSKYNSLTEPRRPFMYIPLQQEYVPQINLHVRTTSDAAAMISTLRQEVQQIDPNLSVGNAQTLKDRIENSLGGERSQATLYGTAGILALILAAAGLYGVMAYTVAQRTREIGIRMALGASRGNVMGLVLKQGVTLVSVGIALGLIAAFGTTRFLLASLLFGVSALDPITFVGTSAVLVVAALLASVVPARRATKVDPIIALRYE